MHEGLSDSLDQPFVDMPKQQITCTAVKCLILCEICNLCFITAQNINCGYSLELPHSGNSNKNPLTCNAIKAANGNITMHVHCWFFSKY